MRGTPVVFDEFKQGVNLKAAPYSLDQGQARDALNVHSGPTGAIVKRNGSQGIKSFGSGEAGWGGIPRSIYGGKISGTSFLIMQAGTKFWKPPLEGEAVAVPEIESEVVSTTNTRWDFIQASWESGKKTAVFGMNGVNEPVYYENTGKVKKWTGEEIPSGAKYPVYHENRVYCAKGSTLYWSDIVNPFSFKSPAGGSTLIDPEDGQEITGIGKAGSYLLVFKNRKTFLLTDSNNGYYRRISATIGCASHRSIVETEQGTFFLTSSNEICVTDGSSFNIQIGERIQPMFSTITNELKQNVCGIAFGSKIYFSLPYKSSNNNYIIEYDLLQDAWWPHRLIIGEQFPPINNNPFLGGVTQFAIADSASETSLYGVSTITGTVGVETETSYYIWRLFIPERYVDNASYQYPVEYKTPWLVFGYPHLKKRIREVRIDSLNEYSLYAYTSFSSSAEEKDYVFWEAASEEAYWLSEDGTLWGADTTTQWGGEPIIGERRFYTLGQGRAWSFKIYAKSAVDLEIYSYTVSYDLRKD